MTMREKVEKEVRRWVDSDGSEADLIADLVSLVDEELKAITEARLKDGHQVAVWYAKCRGLREALVLSESALDRADKHFQHGAGWVCDALCKARAALAEKEEV